MEYGAKWIRENLGIQRDELRSYEKAGLIPIKKDGCFYRTYNDNEIERIWYIRVFKGMGYTLKELREIAENDDFDYFFICSMLIYLNDVAKIVYHSTII